MARETTGRERGEVMEGEEYEGAGKGKTTSGQRVEAEGMRVRADIMGGEKVGEGVEKKEGEGTVSWPGN